MMKFKELLCKHKAQQDIVTPTFKRFAFYKELVFKILIIILDFYNIVTYVSWLNLKRKEVSTYIKFDLLNLDSELFRHVE